MLKVTIFTLVSAAILYVSWSSLLHPRTHGFFRFFAFEALTVLILLNVDNWFRDPFSTLQMISWTLLLSSLLLAIHGFYLLVAIGKPEGDVENTSVLVKKGAYRYIRHPLYSTLLLGTCGVFLKDISLMGGILSLATCTFILLTAKTEESENLKKFGDVYAEYMKSTRMFVPFVY